MSQNQSPDFLSDDEIKDFFRKSFDLELDKDALIKPTSNIILDIYARFLDEFYCQEWINSEYSTDEPNVTALMVRWINFTIAPYDVNTTFQLKDLLKPVRKRTNYFLNVLIFVKVSLDEVDMPLWQTWRGEWAEIQDESDRAHAELNSLRLRLEELAIRKSTSSQIDEIREVRDSKRIIFDNSKRTTDELHEISKPLKSDIEYLHKLVADHQARGDKIYEEYHQLEEKLASLDKNIAIEEKIAIVKKSLQSRTNELRESEKNSKEPQRKALQKLMDSTRLNAKNCANKDDLENKKCLKWQQEEDTVKTRLDQANSHREKLEHRETEIRHRLERVERDRGKKKLPLEIGKEQILMDRQEKISILKERAQPSTKCEEIKNDEEAIKKERVTLLKKQNAIKEEHQARVDKANRQLESFFKIFQESQNKCEPGVMAIEAYNARIESLMGKPKEVELPANRTYIKV